VELLLYPTHTLPTAAAPVLVGIGLAIHDGVLALAPALVGFLGSWLIHLAGVFTDNHELLRRHPDLPEHPELTQAVRDGTLKLSTLRAAIVACLALACLTVPYLLPIGGAPVLAYGAVGFFLMFGAVAVPATYYIQAAAQQGAPLPWRLLASLPLSAYLVGLPAGALVTSVMLIDDVRDRVFDAAKGWRTGAVRRGAAWTAREVAVLVAFAYAVPAACWIALPFDAWVLLPLASLPLALAVVRALRTARERTDLVPLTPRMARLAVVHSALLAAGLALSS
jgi:1,4-dihydroxy-2-naphthoate octaprenyltransferase